VVCVLVALGLVLTACSPEPAVFHEVPELSARREAVRGVVKVAGFVREEPRTRSDIVTFDLFAQNRDPVSVPVVFAKADFPGLSAEELDGRAVIVIGTFDGEKLHGEQLVVRFTGPYDSTVATATPAP